MIRPKYKDILKRMSKAGVADSTIARIAGVHVDVIRKIFFKNGYKPTERKQQTIMENIDDFLSLLKK